MLQKLRQKIVIFFMSFAAVVIVLTMVFVCVSVARNNATINEAQLQSVLTQSSSFYKSAPDRSSPINFSYLLVEVLPSGKAYISGDLANSFTQDELLSVLNKTLSCGKTAGVLKEDCLRYYVEPSSITTRIAYMDYHPEILALRKIMVSSALIGLCALFVLLFISILLSRIATKPVETSWTQQKQFLSDASHELKTPLTVILSSADLLESSVSGKAAEYVDNIQAEGYRMKELVESMLMLSRLEKTPSVHFSSVDFSDVVTDCCLHFEPLAFETGHSIVSDIEPNLSLNGDVNHLARLCGILLDNAIKYADSRSTIEVSLKQNGKTITLSVTNTCEPIPPDKLPHLFDRFYRSDDSRSSVDGFGLGLSIAKKIVELHGGKISCVSYETTTFQVDFLQSR